MVANSKDVQNVNPSILCFDKPQNGEVPIVTKETSLTVSHLDGEEDCEHSKLDRLVMNLNHCSNEVLRYINNSFQAAIKCGETLCEIKSLLPHGSYVPFLEKNFHASIRCAQQYSRLYRKFKKIPKSARGALLALDPTIGGFLKSADAGKSKSPVTKGSEADQPLAQAPKPQRTRVQAETSPAIEADRLSRRHIGELVRGIDKVARLNGGKGQYHAIANTAINQLISALKKLREGHK